MSRWPNQFYTRFVQTWEKECRTQISTSAHRINGWVRWKHTHSLSMLPASSFYITKSSLCISKSLLKVENTVLLDFLEIHFGLLLFNFPFSWKEMKRNETKRDEMKNKMWTVCPKGKSCLEITSNKMWIALILWRASN